MAFASSPTSTATSPASSMDESYLLWLLSDSNLPTGGFVASSGLESYVSHGFLHLPPADGAPSSSSSSTSTSARARTGKSKEDQMAEATLRFLQDSLGSYARSALPFLAGAHRVTCRYLDSNPSNGKEAETRLEECLSQLTHLEQTYHSLSLNHVLRRASRAQGIALLTLYARSFSSVPVSASLATSSSGEEESGKAAAIAQEGREARSQRAAGLIDALKRRVRLASVKGGAPYGHLPTCWAAFTACLGVGLRSATSLHLFLQARSVLSSSVRLNTLGPYLAHGLLLGPVRDMLRRLEGEVNTQDGQGMSASGEQGKSVQEAAREEETRADTVDTKGSASTSTSTSRRFDSSAFEWDWEEEGDWYSDELSSGHGPLLGQSGLRPPVNTWPLGEIVQGRHDALHSRLFNS